MFQLGWLAGSKALQMWGRHSANLFLYPDTIDPAPTGHFFSRPLTVLSVATMHLLIVSWLLLLPLAAASWISPTQETLGLHMSRPNKELSLTHDLVKFHQNLTQIESITGNEKEVGDWLTESLESQGYRVRRQSVDTPHRFNVYAWPGSNRYAPTVLLTSHIDTVRPMPHEKVG